MNRKTVKHASLGGLGVLVAFSGLVAFAHTSVGRPLLGWMRGAPGCPVSLEGGDAKTVEAFRVAHLKREVGAEPSRGNPALGFELGRSDRTSVSSWARASGAACKTLREESVLRCTGFRKADGEALAIDDAHLQFDARGMLVAADVYRVRTNAAAALAFVRSKANLLDAVAGPHTQSSGPTDSDSLQLQPFSRAAITYKYQRYVAELSATNLADRGIRVRERYSYLPSTTLALNAP
ncbi:MAG TPA: hypothetical protein VK524_32620 [Polyangiaceae bacterium]|nr:hypothetical protein [Polyangiaceae bacterium]